MTRGDDERTPSTKARGDAAEAAAARLLLSKGYEILAQQVRAGGVEIDLVVRAPDEDPPLLVFVEVRSRSDLRLGHPLETVDAAKQRRLIRGATAWLTERDLLGRVQVRFDVMAWELPLEDLRRVADADESQCSWIRGAFEADG